MSKIICQERKIEICFFDFPFWLEETVSDNIKLAKALSQIIKSAVAKFNYSKGE